MKYILVFFVCLAFSYGSLSANETKALAQKQSQTHSTIRIGIGQEKKCFSYTKIRFLSTKARFHNQESIIPNSFYKARNKVTLLVKQNIAYGKTLENFSYQYIFSYLYPKHVFW